MMARGRGRTGIVASQPKTFRDPVHGDVELDRDLELPLIDTREFQRLRGVKQLGTAHLVYPGALHTRFEHSLGTCWMARRILASIARRGVPVPDDVGRAIRLAALLHDVGHIPYGHTLEDERRILERHDKPERLARALGAGELGTALERTGLAPQVLAILAGTPDAPFAAQIVGAAIGADLLDYLARDAYFCGVGARYDERVVRRFTVVDGQLVIDAQKEGALREDVLSEVVNLLRLRYFLGERVYYHHAKTASGAMVSKAVELALDLGLAPRELLELRDDGLFALLRARFGGTKPLDLLLDALDRHAIYKRCYLLTRKVGAPRVAELAARYHADRAAREAAERALEKAARLAPGELVIYCPDADMALAEAKVPIAIDRGAPRMLSALDIPEVSALAERHRALWKFYVLVHPRRHARFAKVAAACERYFQEGNHLPAFESGQMYFRF